MRYLIAVIINPVGALIYYAPCRHPLIHYAPGVVINPVGVLIYYAPVPIHDPSLVDNGTGRNKLGPLQTMRCLMAAIKNPVGALIYYALVSISL